MKTFPNVRNYEKVGYLQTILEFYKFFWVMAHINIFFFGDRDNTPLLHEKRSDEDIYHSDERIF